MEKMVAWKWVNPADSWRGIWGKALPAHDQCGHISGAKHESVGRRGCGYISHEALPNLKLPWLWKRGSSLPPWMYHLRKDDQMWIDEESSTNSLSFEVSMILSHVNFETAGNLFAHSVVFFSEAKSHCWILWWYGNRWMYDRFKLLVCIL